MKLKIYSFLVVAMILIAITGIADAVDCDCHNVGVTSWVEPARMNLGSGKLVTPQEIVFYVKIFNSGTYDENTISYRLIEDRTGKTLYYNQNLIPFLYSGENQIFDIHIPISELTSIDCSNTENGWTFEGYKMIIYYQNSYWDCLKLDNTAINYIKMKPDCRKI